MANRRPGRRSRRGLAIAASGLVGFLSVGTIFGVAKPSAAQDIVVINGRGFGHGVGLAQDGAYWMGRAGRNATEILRLFFPGTVIAKRGGTVRVPLGGGGSAQLNFPNGGSIGGLRVPAGGSVSVRASNGEVVASELRSFSSNTEKAENTSPSDPATPVAQNNSANTTPIAASAVDQISASSVTPSAVGTAALARQRSVAGEPDAVEDQGNLYLARFSAVRTDPSLRESLLSQEHNESVQAVERFQADTPIVSSVVTVPATSASSATSAPNPTFAANPSTPTPPTSPISPIGDVAPTDPTPTNPAPTNRGPTAVGASAAPPTPEGGVPNAPIVTTVETAAGAAPTSVSSSLPNAANTDSSSLENTGNSAKTRNGTTQGSTLSASSGGATIDFNGRRYRGSIDFDAGGNSLRITNSVDLEDYLKGMGEILTPSWPSAALQSQAIAARTYALRTMAIDGQVCPTQRCQVYLGAQAEYGKMNAAVDATRGKVLTYGGKLAATFYSASGGGTIATPEEGFGGGSSQQPYLKAGSYPTGDVLAWTVRMPLGEVARRVGYGGSPRGVTITRVGPSGRALEVTIDGSSGPQRIGGPKFDAALGLKSTFFTINEPVFGSSGSGGIGGTDSGPGGSSGSASDLSSALAALGLSNAVSGVGSDELSRLLSVADPDFAAGSASTLPPTNLVPSASDSQTMPDFGSASAGSAGSASEVSAYDTTSVPSTFVSVPKPTQPDNSAGSTIEAINLPSLDDASPSGAGDVVFLAVPTALLGLVGFGLRRRMKSNRSAAAALPRGTRQQPRRPRPTTGSRPGPGQRSSDRTALNTEARRLPRTRPRSDPARSKAPGADSPRHDSRSEPRHDSRPDSRPDSQPDLPRRQPVASPQTVRDPAHGDSRAEDAQRQLLGESNLAPRPTAPQPGSPTAGAQQVGSQQLGLRRPVSQQPGSPKPGSLGRRLTEQPATPSDPTSSQSTLPE